MYRKKDILKQAEKIKQALQNTEEITFYHRTEKKINQNKKVAQKLAQIKSLQKQVVNLEHYEKYRAKKQIESEMASLQKEIDELPVVVDFKRAQHEANDLLQSIIAEINQQITDNLQ